MFFLVAFLVLSASAFGLYYFQTKEENASISSEFGTSRTRYLIIYLLVMGADWLQGPYVYALYAEYGFNQAEIAQLFVAGFGSSMIFGTIVGAVADKFGRKLNCVLFGVLYSIACLTKLVNSYWVLMIGRLLSGVATSILFSAFESWMVHEHHAQHFAESWLGGTFSLSTTCNGVVAVVAGLVAGFAADNFGAVSPFMISLLLLIIATVLVSTWWTENYGDTKLEVQETLQHAIQAVTSDSRVLLLGLVQSLFEAAMYTFVFMWTPAVNAAGGMPLGLIFAIFMICTIIGSLIFGYAMTRGYTPEAIETTNMLVSTVVFLVPVFSTNVYLLLACFFVFEACVGVHFPAAGTLRSRIIPEQSRAGVMNMFRVPLNLMVILVLLKIKALSQRIVFLLCACWLAVAWLAGTRLMGVKSSSERATGGSLLSH
eukprot:TRINITY_DN4688_c0_g1_i4.p1 TRINITY_DN4688_c0_g1~~TRINITY_DN4688_c0_g1_i4.p1  ORF type:complete len:428 (-),score=75.01 TRINITY_DN4688_c0_g1_i4:31-1314(-)